MDPASAPASNPSDTTAPGPLPEATLLADVKCLHCGYNLRTLAADGTCPECGRPVAETLRGCLQLAPVAWLRCVARGLLIVLIAIGLYVLIMPIVSVLVIMVPSFLAGFSTGAGPQLGSYFYAQAVVQAIGSLVVKGVLIYGLILATRPDPRAPAAAEGFTARKLVRWCLPFVLVPTILNYAAALRVADVMAEMFPPGGTTTAPVPPSFAASLAPTMALSYASGAIEMAIYAVAGLALIAHVRGLMRRANRPGLVRFARIVFWGLIASTVGTIAAYVLLAVFSFSTYQATSAMLAPVTTTSVAVSTQPTTAPGVAAPVAPAGPMMPFPGGSFVGMVAGGFAVGLATCSMLGFGVAGLVLLTMVCVALYRTASVARHAAAPAAPLPAGTAASPGPPAA